MLLSLLQQSKFNVFVLTLRITNYGNNRNGGCPQRTAYQNHLYMSVRGLLHNRRVRYHGVSVYVPVC
jgi:hypothetical protein